MDRLKGKLIVITGASSGIGRACAERCASRGADLVLAARRIERLQELKSRLEKEHAVSVDIHRLDVRDRAGVRSFADVLKGSSRLPDVLINNAGLASGFSPLQEGDFEDWDRMIDTNIKGLLNVSRALIPLMAEKGSGHVVNVGSIAGHQVYPRGNVYNATKFAVRALTEGMNLDLVGTNIRASSVSPGAVHTEFSEVRFHGDRERAEQVYQGYEPLGADDVADAVLYIISAPEHVNIQELIITPAAQRNVYVWDRRES
jgi:3-hydroxy acid dehydrogenase/malonic semialdehyde reductase